MISDNGSEQFIQTLNKADIVDAERMLEPIFECSPWLAQRIANTRPYANLQALADRIKSEVFALSAPQAMSLLNAHPQLAPPAPSRMTATSQEEQARLAIGQPTADIAEQLRGLNDRYQKRHGFPFIIALHAAPNLDSVLARFASSVGEDTEAEITRALGEVVSVATARLARKARSGLAIPLERDR